MENNTENEELVYEEQEIVDELIEKIDHEKKRLEEKYKKKVIAEKKFTERYPDNKCGMPGGVEENSTDIQKKLNDLNQSGDELYGARVRVAMQNDNTSEEQELKIGYHICAVENNILIYSWVSKVCRQLFLDNCPLDFNAKEDSNGKACETHYHLLLKRKVDIKFYKVKSVVQFFPVISEKIISDEFLKELLKRRSDKEFRSIVFSIQKKQGEIVQAPFRQNLIVQGCAGSGKSMIMLHRLPILLYDNPNSLARKDLFIITPSSAYIQLAKNMMSQLEISDLNIGTAQKYYEFLIEKYGKTKNEYGQIDASIILSAKQEQFIYSESCIKKIQELIEAAIQRGVYESDQTKRTLRLSTKISLKSNFPRDRISAQILELQQIINKNDEILGIYVKLMQDAVNSMKGYLNSSENLKMTVMRSIKQEISDETLIIDRVKNEIKKLNPNSNELAIKKRNEIIHTSEDHIKVLIDMNNTVTKDTDYFEKLKTIGQPLQDIVKDFSMLSEINVNDDWKAVYDYILKIGHIIGAYYTTAYYNSRFNKKYPEYDRAFIESFQALTQNVAKLQSLNTHFLEMAEYEKVWNTISYLKKIFQEMPMICYKGIMKMIGIDMNNKNTVPSCSTYLFLQILYQYYGMPNAAKESLISIDESQGFAPSEIKLIKEINDNRVILNLFGDINQHIEGTKGIDSWDELADISNYKEYVINENYRNARQITEYCNKAFSMHMNAINLSGKGVHRMESEEELNHTVRTQLECADKQGLCAVIVKNAKEAMLFLRVFGTFQSSIHYLSDSEGNIYNSEWNLLTANAAKGLEFNTVIALSGNMTDHEKYITYTRALDELYIFDEPIAFHEKEDLSSSANTNKMPEEKQPPKYRRFPFIHR